MLTLLTLTLSVVLLVFTYRWAQCCPIRCALSSAAVIALLSTVTGITPICLLCWAAVFFAMMFWLPSLEGKRVMWQMGGLVISVV